MEKQKCNTCDVADGHVTVHFSDGYEVMNVTVEECEITYVDQEIRVVERVTTIKAEKTSRGDYKNKSITLATLSAAFVSFVGLLADIPSAVDYLKAFLL